MGLVSVSGREDASSLFPEGVWSVPVELALALPTSSVMRGVVRARMERQDHPAGARVFARGNRFFAEMCFSPTRASVLWPLDVWVRP